MGMAPKIQLRLLGSVLRMQFSSLLKWRRGHGLRTTNCLTMLGSLLSSHPSECPALSSFLDQTTNKESFLCEILQIEWGNICIFNLQPIFHWRRRFYKPMESFWWEVHVQPRGRNLVGAQKHDSTHLCMDLNSPSNSGGTDSSIDVVLLWLSVATSNKAPACPGGFKKATQLMIFR